MEHKDEKRQTPGNQDERNTTPRPDNTPVTNHQQTSEDASLIALHRPWTNREHTLDDTLQKEHWWKAKSHKGDALERWSTQPMADGPYQNVKSVVNNTKSKQSNASEDKLPRQPAPVSETAATSGSGLDEAGREEKSEEEKKD
ncbi:hypothetical protein F4781DRAFT_130722 [Annulohypoxylon bovei var. microspora]|nr:hypothetical protein F4781DRAFT_130722 [Annulohypoxylon bovei var. microspora]